MTFIEVKYSTFLTFLNKTTSISIFLELLWHVLARYPVSLRPKSLCIHFSLCQRLANHDLILPMALGNCKGYKVTKEDWQAKRNYSNFCKNTVT